MQRMFLISLSLLFHLNASAEETMCYAESPTLLNLNCDRKSDWTLGIGFETEYGSAADGSKELEFEIEPGAILHWNLGDWNQFFFNGQETGVRTFPNRWLNLMFGVRFEPGREESDDPKLLKGQGNSDDEIMGRAEFRLNLHEDWKAWTGLTSLIGDQDIGSLHILFVGYSFKDIGLFDLDIFAFQRFASSAFINKDFGVDSVQSVNSGNPIYQADGGEQSYGITAIGRVNLNPVIVLIETGYDKYAHRLDRSPIIQKGQNYEYEIGATVLYLF
jgi:outer membrane protein